MTDTEQKIIKEICKVAHIDDISDLSDGYHTFRQLYYQRMMLFAALVKQNRDKAWKSIRHEDGELCFGGGWFIVGIDTPEGSYTYHYAKKYWDMFDCEELECGKEWDGHTEEEVTRLLSLQQEPKWIPVSERLPEFMHHEDEFDGGYYISERVLIYTEDIHEPEYGPVCIAQYEKYHSEGRWVEGWYSEPISSLLSAVAWMPLPEPYKASPTGG